MAEFIMKTTKNNCLICFYSFCEIVFTKLLQEIPKSILCGHTRNYHINKYSIKSKSHFITNRFTELYLFISVLLHWWVRDFSNKHSEEDVWAVQKPPSSHQSLRKAEGS